MRYLCNIYICKLGGGTHGNYLSLQARFRYFYMYGRDKDGAQRLLDALMYEKVEQLTNNLSSYRILEFQTKNLAFGALLMLI